MISTSIYLWKEEKSLLELLTEKLDLWDYLKSTKKPIYLYGMGDGALKIMAVLQKYNIEYTGIFASDEFVRGHSFCGHKVKKFSEVKSLHQNDFIALLSFASFLPNVMTQIYSMQNECELFAPDVPVIKTDDVVFNIEYIKSHEKELDTIYSLLADEQSKKTLIGVLNYKISGKIDYLRQIETDICEVYENIIFKKKCDCYVDLGAYTGDTISEFLSFKEKITGENSCEKILAFEPDRKNFAKLQKRTLEENIKNVQAENLAVWNEKATLSFDNCGGRNSKKSDNGFTQITADSVDNLLLSGRADVIKFDVEGVEEQALIGCEQTIKNFSPTLMISAYHKNCDIFSLPLLALSMNKNYKIYLRHHPYIPSWETNYYMISQN